MKLESVVGKKVICRAPARGAGLANVYVYRSGLEGVLSRRRRRTVAVNREVDVQVDVMKGRKELALG